MNVRHADKALARIETDATYNRRVRRTGGQGVSQVHGVHPCPRDERDFYAAKSLHYEMLKGDRQGQRAAMGAG